MQQNRAYAPRGLVVATVPSACAPTHFNHALTGAEMAFGADGKPLRCADPGADGILPELKPLRRQARIELLRAANWHRCRAVVV